MNLFDPITIGDCQLSNRIAMAPLTRNRAKATIPNEMMRIYYNQRSTAGLIISEATNISSQATGYVNTPGIYTNLHIEKWKRITDSVHHYGGKIYCQLWHVGRSSHSDFHNGKLPVAPSAIASKGQIKTPYGLKDKEVPRELEISEIKQVIDDYANAAENAIKAGFDGVEIHGANGYLIDQFICDGSNQRTDEYGGSIENRCKFALEVVKAVSDRISRKKVAIKLSPSGTFNSMNDSTVIETFSYLIKELNNFSLSYLHLAEFYNPPGKSYKAPAHYLQEGEVIKYFRKIYKGIIVGNSGFDFKKANEYISKSYCDIIAFGKLFISNPDLPRRFKENDELNDWDVSTFYTDTEKGYIDYPFNM